MDERVDEFLIEKYIETSIGTVYCFGVTIR